jgi:hypothetical protein
MMSRFCRYMEKVFDFGFRIGQLQDPRRRPRIPLGAIWGSVFFLFALRQRSLHAMEGQLRQPRRMERLIGPKKPSADRMGQVLSLIDPNQLRAMLSGINHQVGRNKRLKNNWPSRVGTIDGHEFFSLPSSLLSSMLAAACVRERRRGSRILSPRSSLLSRRVPQNKHTAIHLDMEMLLLGEGELTAAQRLLPRVVQSYGRFFRVVLADALFFSAPFFHLCLGLRKEVITVLKDEDRVLFQDALGVFSFIAPQVWEEPNQKIRAWDDDGFTSAEGIEVPLGILHTEEVITRRHRDGKGWIQKKETHHWEWVTTLSVARLPTYLLWQIGHGRWETENDLFHTLATYRSLV